MANKKGIKIESFPEIGGDALYAQDFRPGQRDILPLSVKDRNIEELTVNKLLAGTITSKTVTLAVTDGEGDAYFNAGITEFDNTQCGFILGIDDSDSNKAKFYIGSTTVYFNWDATNLTVVGGTITGGTIQTATSGARIVITSNTLTVYDATDDRVLLGSGIISFASAGTAAGSVYAQSGGGTGDWLTIQGSGGTGVYIKGPTSTATGVYFD